MGQPPRRFNRDVRPREYLTPKEVERLIAAAKKRGRRYGLRDAPMMLLAFRHGLRVSELCTLTWNQIDFSHGLIQVRRLKNGIPSVHQLGGEEMRCLRALKREDGGSRYVFMTERWCSCGRYAAAAIAQSRSGAEQPPCSLALGRRRSHTLISPRAGMLHNI